MWPTTREREPSWSWHTREFLGRTGFFSPAAQASQKPNLAKPPGAGRCRPLPRASRSRSPENTSPGTQAEGFHRWRQQVSGCSEGNSAAAPKTAGAVMGAASKLRYPSTAHMAPSHATALRGYTEHRRREVDVPRKGIATARSHPTARNLPPSAVDSLAAPRLDTGYDHSVATILACAVGWPRYLLPLV